MLGAPRRVERGCRPRAAPIDGHLDRGGLCSHRRAWPVAAVAFALLAISRRRPRAARAACTVTLAPLAGISIRAAPSRSRGSRALGP
jgi:hypothetical protein